VKDRKKKRVQERDDFPSPEDNAFVEKVKVLAEPLCNAEGMELVFIEYQAEPGGKILRIYIDQPGGVTLDDCVNISRQLSDLLDVSLESDEPYKLEVSSPGTNRPLGKRDDFVRFKGHAIKIQTSQPIDGQKKFKGTLLGAEDDIVTIMANEKSVAIHFDTITKARLINYNGES